MIDGRESNSRRAPASLARSLEVGGKTERRWSRRETLRVLAAGAVTSRLFASRRVYAGNPRVEETAGWLAGLSPLAGVAPSIEWTAYAKLESDRWGMNQRRIVAMRSWSLRELASFVPPNITLFYPFAGPDALHAISLFGPHLKAPSRMILVGLEPVGTLPDPESTPEGFFRRLGAAQGDVHRLTFFRTREMSLTFQKEGVLSTLVATVARMGGIVSSVQTTHGPNSARIDWNTTEGTPGRLEYFQLDLANAHFKTESPLLSLLRSTPHITFIKAAMYLLREARFSILREHILDSSALVIQDDTGIPFRFFGPQWVTRLYGHYEVPGPPFDGAFQPDLAAAFDNRGTAPLPFGIGYHVRPERSNLVVAARGGKS